MLASVFLSCLLLQASLAQDSLQADVRSVLGDPQSDAYIDQILENLRQMIMEQGLDPMTLPDLETGFSDTILGLSLSPSRATLFTSHLLFKASPGTAQPHSEMASSGVCPPSPGPGTPASLWWTTPRSSPPCSASRLQRVTTTLTQNSWELGWVDIISS